MAPGLLDTSEPAPGALVPRWLALTLVSLVIFASYGGTLGNGFVHDDRAEIVENRFVHDLTHIRGIFTTPSWGFDRQAYEEPGLNGYQAESNYYRPLQYLSYAALYSAFGPAPAAFHAFKLILHLLACALLYSSLVHLRREQLAFPCALLFAVHPALSEAVAWISAVTDVGCTVCFLLAFWAYLRWKRKPGLVRLLPLHGAFLVGMFYKETTIVFVPLLLIWQRLGEGAWPRWPSDWRRVYAPLGAIAIFYLAVRVSVLGGLVVAGRQRFGTLTFTQSILNQTVLLSEYLVRFVRPEPLNAFHVFDPVLSLWDPRFAVAVALLAGAGATVLAISRQLEVFNRRLLLLGVLWGACALVPPIVFFQRIGENVFAERYLYLPFSGLCLATAAALSPLLRRQPWPTLAGLAVLASLGVWRVRERIPVWHDAVTFYEDVMRRSPKAPLWQSLGDAYVEEGRLDEAVNAYRSMLVSWPRRYETYCNLGNALYRLRRFDEAVAAYRSSLSIEPNEAAFSNLGIVLHEQGLFEEAIVAFGEALALRPTSRAYHNLATTYYIGLHRLPEAAAAYEAALRLRPDNEESRKALDLLREEERARGPQ